MSTSVYLIAVVYYWIHCFLFIETEWELEEQKLSINLISSKDIIMGAFQRLGWAQVVGEVGQQPCIIPLYGAIASKSLSVVTVFFPLGNSESV